MRTAVVSDIHGNLPAIEAVVADAVASGCDAIVNLGDCLSGPLWPADTAAFLIRQGWPTIAGNHERQLLGASDRYGRSDAFAAASLSADHWDWLRSLPPSMVVDDMLMCHGTPVSDLDHFLFSVEPAGLVAASDAELIERAGAFAELLICCGHTHLQARRQTSDGRTIFNPSSVGLQAFDDERPYRYLVENDDPRARYAIVENGEIDLRAIAYDHMAAARKAESEGFDDWARWLATGRD